MHDVTSTFNQRVPSLDYTVELTLIRLVPMMLFNSKGTSTTDTDYSCNIEAVELN